MISEFVTYILGGIIILMLLYLIFWILYFIFNYANLVVRTVLDFFK